MILFRYDQKTLLYRATLICNKALSGHYSPRPPSVWQDDSRTPICRREKSHLFRPRVATRVEFVELSGFDLREAGADYWEKLWVRGGFPRSFLARSDGDSLVWREGFIRTFLERDIPQLGVAAPSATMRRLWMMLAHYHGQTW